MPAAPAIQVPAHVPGPLRKLYARAVAGTIRSRSAAIKLKCWDCCAWIRFEGGEDKIGGCVVRTCPSWSLRPYATASGATRAPKTGTASGEEEAA